MHYSRTVVCVLLLGGVCTCAKLLLALTPEQQKAAHVCDGVYLDKYTACLESHPLQTEQCTHEAYDAYKTCRKNSGLPMKSPPQVPKGRGDHPSGKPSPTASPTRSPLRHVDDLGKVQTQTLTTTSPTPTPKPSRSVSHRKD
jgi:hypothetical protein